MNNEIHGAEILRFPTRPRPATRAFGRAGGASIHAMPAAAFVPVNVDSWYHEAAVREDERDRTM